MSRQLSAGVIGRRKGGIDIDIQNYISSVGGDVDNTFVSIINNHISKLKSDLGISLLNQAFDQILLLSNDRQDLSLINLCKSKNNATIVGDVIFEQFKGSNRVTGYVNTNYTPSIDTDNFTLNNGSFGIYSNTDGDLGVNYDMGARNGFSNRQTFICVKTSINTLRMHCSDNAGGNDNTTVSTESNTMGLFCVNRLNNENVEFYENGIKEAERAYLSTELTSASMYIHAVNNNNSTIVASTIRQHALAYIGRGFSEAEMSIINTHFTNMIEEIKTLAL